MTHRSVSAHPFIAFRLDLMAAPADNGCRHSTAVLQVAVGRIDDGVDGFCGDITLNKLDQLPGGEFALSHDPVHNSLLIEISPWDVASAGRRSGAGAGGEPPGRSPDRC